MSNPLDPSKVSVTVGGKTVSVGGKVDGVPVRPGMPDPNLVDVVPTVQTSLPDYLKNFAEGAKIDPDRYIALIQGQSPNVLWEKVCVCPNSTDNGTHDPTCDLCLHGMLFFDPQKIPMLVTTASLQQTFYLQGRYSPGSIVVTVAPTNQISEGDRVTVLDSSVRTTTKRRRNSDSLIDRVKYPIKDVVLLRTRDKTFNLGTDFSITEDGAIQWEASVKRRPAKGAFYSVVYTHAPIYIITDMLHAHRDRRVTVGGKSGTVAGPIQAMAKADFLARDEGKDEQDQPNPSPYGRT